LPAAVFERSAWEEAVIVGLCTAVMQLSVLAGFDEDKRAAQIRVIVGTAIGILCAHLFAAVLGRQFMSEQGCQPSPSTSRSPSGSWRAWCS
jgi:hypothetical protein